VNDSEYSEFEEDGLDVSEDEDFNDYYSNDLILTVRNCRQAKQDLIAELQKIKANKTQTESASQGLSLKASYRLT
jgi:hypothetical protein